MFLHLGPHPQVVERGEVDALDLELHDDPLAGLRPLAGQGGRGLDRFQRGYGVQVLDAGQFGQVFLVDGRPCADGRGEFLPGLFLHRLGDRDLELRRLQFLGGHPPHEVHRGLLAIGLLGLVHLGEVLFPQHRSTPRRTCPSAWPAAPWAPGRRATSGRPGPGRPSPAPAAPGASTRRQPGSGWRRVVAAKSNTIAEARDRSPSCRILRAWGSPPDCRAASSRAPSTVGSAPPRA